MLLGALLAYCPSDVAGQQLPFAVPMFDWERKALDKQRQAYRSEASQYEVLFCVESWTTDEATNGVQRMVITRVRRAAGGGKHNIADLESYCVANDGNPLPTIHTHSDGNCQFSPSDLITIAARGAPFEGVQCGERHFIWTSRWQVVAMANGVQVQRPARITSTP